MENKQRKTYKKMDNGKALIKIYDDGPVFIPDPHGTGKNILIGDFDQITTQLIDGDKINTLKSYLNNQIMSSQANLEKIELNLQNLENINTSLIPDDLIPKLKKALEKGTKGTKKALLPIAQYIQKRDIKMNMIQQKGQHEEKIVLMKKDMLGLQKVAPKK